jgi:23S rRNA pseudouridine2457 synthase
MFSYLIFHKPFQVLSQFSPEDGKRTLADYFFSIAKDIYPVGRLDYDSEGLLLLTNDKKLTHQLLEPKHGHQRTYWVQVEGELTAEAIKRLEKGVTIKIDGKEHRTAPAIATLLTGAPPIPDRDPPIRYRKSIPTSWLQLTITEGKNRQVRKMTAAAGFPTLRLIRHSIGNISIDGLSPGDYRELSVQELQQLPGQK